MLDTNKIIVENIKALVSKVKTWVEDLYPITYTENGNISNLSFYTTKAKLNTFLNFDSNNGKTDISVMSNKMSVNGDSAEIKVADLCRIGESTASNVVMNVDGTTTITGVDSAQLSDVSNKESVAVDSANGSIIIKALNKIKVRIGSAISGATYSQQSQVRIEDGCFVLDDNQGGGTPHGRLLLGIKPEDITVNEPYGLYLGHTTPVGYEFSRTDTGQVTTGTTFRGWTSSNTGVYKASPTFGTWLATYSILCANCSDKMRIAGRWFLDGEELLDGACTQASAGTGQMAIQGTSTIRVPYGVTGNLELRMYQNSGSTKECTVNIHLVRVA